MHHVDRDTPWDEIWQAMEVLVAQGKILYTGSSNFAGWHIAQACETAKARGYLGLVSEQSLYNLATRWIELEVLPAARAYGVGVIPWSPLEGGLLGGVLAAEREGRRRLAGRAKAIVEAHRERIEAWEELCGKLDEEPAHVALAWLLHQDGVTAPIIGPRTLDQLDTAQRALGIHLDADVLARLDEISRLQDGSRALRLVTQCPRPARLQESGQDGAATSRWRPARRPGSLSSQVRRHQRTRALSADADALTRVARRRGLRGGRRGLGRCLRAGRGGRRVAQPWGLRRAGPGRRRRGRRRSR
jgi:diketogulonate reductase-like aldo/keto reductase